MASYDEENWQNISEYELGNTYTYEYCYRLVACEFLYLSDSFLRTA